MNVDFSLDFPFSFHTQRQEFLGYLKQAFEEKYFISNIFEIFIIGAPFKSYKDLVVTNKFYCMLKESLRQYLPSKLTKNVLAKIQFALVLEFLNLS